MSVKRLCLFFSFFLLIFFGVSPTYSELLNKDGLLSKLLFENVNAFHYSSPKINDAYSKKAWTSFIERLDPNKRFFTQEDITKLTIYQLTIDDEIKSNHFVFYEEIFRLYDKRLAQISELSSDLLKKPFDYSRKQSIETDPKKRHYVKNEEQLKDLWKTLLSFQILSTYVNLPEAKKSGGGFNPSLESEARKKVAKDLEQNLKSIKKEKPAERLAMYFESLMTVFDPHTTYLAPEEKENFNIGMRGTLEGIGAMLKEDGDYIKVTSVIPGGPAWKQKELKSEDIILKVAQSDQEPVDIVGMRVNEAVKLIRGKKGTEVRLTVKSPQGTIHLITIIRDVVVIEETYAKSAILESKNNKKIGYISLPVFYHDFDKNNARNAADDIEKAVNKLKKNKLGGLILDLRNNSGGALEDAIKIAGFFIKKGPIVQVRDNHDERQVRWDEDEEILYSGPLVILINGFSASASEIVAAALQDYERAIIIGSDHSYGKGTVQTVLDFDRYIDSDSNLSKFASFLKPLGSLKLTIQKFYRINGGTTQYKGVSSDIVLPDNYDYMDIGEKTIPYSLAWDTIAPLKYSAWKDSYSLVTLKRNSANRVSHSPQFTRIKDNIYKLKHSQKNSLQSLNFKDFYTKDMSTKREAEKMKKSIPDSQFFKVPSNNLESIAPEQKDIVKDWYKQIIKDPYIDEAIHVLEDIH